MNELKEDKFGRRYQKEEQEFEQFPNLAQNWTYSQDYRSDKPDLEELDRECQEKGFKANLEAIYGKEDECKHKRYGLTQFKPVSEKFEISEVLCTDCGKFLGIRQRRVKPSLCLEFPPLDEAEEEEED
jgi:hypothetical protein